MMNHAVSGTFVPGVRENMAYFTSTERRATVYAIPTCVVSRCLCGFIVLHTLNKPILQFVHLRFRTYKPT